MFSLARWRPVNPTATCPKTPLHGAHVRPEAVHWYPARLAADVLACHGGDAGATTQPTCLHTPYARAGSWHARNMAVPLSQLAALDPDESTDEAIVDWHYWVAQGSLLRHIRSNGTELTAPPKTHTTPQQSLTSWVIFGWVHNLYRSTAIDPFGQLEYVHHGSHASACWAATGSTYSAWKSPSIPVGTRHLAAYAPRIGTLAFAKSLPCRKN